MKNDYYVYLHKTLDGKVFYVGKGRNKRAWQKFNRGRGWTEVSSNGYSIEMYAGNLFEKDALAIERGLIETLPNLVNIRALSSVEFDDYSEYFEYDSNSPSGLTRIKGVFTGRYEQGKLGHCGLKVKRSCGGQHWMIKFKNRNTQIHRIIWQLVNGKIPEGYVVDHINGDSLNNNILNLRVVEKVKNSRNTRKRKNNTSGVVGVTLIVNIKRNSAMWQAFFKDLSGKQTSKCFSIAKLGYDEAFRLACEWRVEQIRLLNEQGAGYTSRHGI